MQNLNKKTILVTGAAGFIASHLIEFLLKEGHTVIGLDNFDPFYSREDKEINLAHIRSIESGHFVFHQLDICMEDFYLNIQHDIDVVVHIAAKAGVRPSIENPNDYIIANINGTQHVLDFMKKIGCKKLVFASSSSVYGNNLKVPFSEEDNVDKPISPYAFTKKANELQIHSFHHLYNINAICLRFFTVYGPRQRPDLAIRKFIDLISRDEAITMYGDGKTGRDYTYVADTVSGIVGAINYLEKHENVYEIINLGNSAPVLLKDLIEEIYAALQKQANVRKLPMQPGDVDLTFADISKAHKLLAYEPKTSLREGLKATISWFKETQKEHS